MELQCVMQVAARDHIRDWCIQLDQHARNRQEAVSNLRSQWQSILDFRQLVVGADLHSLCQCLSWIRRFLHVFKKYCLVSWLSRFLDRSISEVWLRGTPWPRWSWSDCTLRCGCSPSITQKIIYKILVVWWKTFFFSLNWKTFHSKSKLNISWRFLCLCLVSVTGICPGQTGTAVWRSHSCSQHSEELHFQGCQTVGNGFSSCTGSEDCWRVRTSCLTTPQSGVYVTNEILLFC